MSNNLFVSCECDIDAGGIISPLLSLHSIRGCGNQPLELHSTKRPLVLGGCTKICISKLVAGWKEKGKTVFLVEEKVKQTEREKSPSPTLIPVPLRHTESQAL